MTFNIDVKSEKSRIKLEFPFSDNTVNHNGRRASMVEIYEYIPTHELIPVKHDVPGTPYLGKDYRRVAHLVTYEYTEENTEGRLYDWPTF